MKSTNKHHRDYIVSVIFVLYLLLGSSLVFANNITITNRKGDDVSNSSTVSSDHIHITVSNFANYTSATYKLSEDDNIPTSWAGISAYDFHEDLYFYKKETDQHIRITLKDTNGSTTHKVITLEGGSLTGHVDNPILPTDYVHMMGSAGLIVEGDDHANVLPEKSVVAMKKAGIGHVRIHIGRLEKDKKTPNPIDANYFKNLDRWVEQITRHGMMCHLGNKTNSIASVTLPEGEHDPLFHDAFDKELTEWWGMIAKRYQYTSHRFAFHTYLETGRLEMFKSGNANMLNPHYQKLTDTIRYYDATRNIIYAPPRINYSKRLDDLTLPYTGSGKYYFSDFHKGFAGGGWHPGEQTYEENIAAALDWMARTNIPLIMSACNANDRVPYPTVKRVEEIKQLLNDVNQGDLPIPITFLKLREFWDDNTGWVEDFDIRARLEAINGEASVDPNDPDGDFLSTDYEINISKTNPNNSDSDMDNISDFIENAIDELDPNNSQDGSPYSDSSVEADFDGDGISNAKELEFATYNINSKTVTQLLNISNPDDSESSLAGSIPNVWESILGFNLNHTKTFLPGGINGSTQYDDETYDHDLDGINTIDEVNNNTWPRTHDEKQGDQDFDFALTGLDDKMPFIHDANYIVGYEFTSVTNETISNQADQGSANTGTLIGDNLSTNGAMLFNNSNLIDIPSDDFLDLTNRTVHFRFMAGSTAKEQVLYSEGDETNGMSVAISGGKIVASAWSENIGTLQEVYLNHVISNHKWYAITTIFDGTKQEFKLALYNENRPVSRTKLSLPFASSNLAVNSKVTLGGVQGNTRIYSNSTNSFTIVDDINFNGYIDDFHVYNRVLSDKEVSVLSRNDLYPAKDPEMPPISSSHSAENLIPNADFEEGETGWSNSGADTRSLVQPGFDGSLNAYQITGSLNKGAQYQPSGLITVDQKEYTMSFGAKGNAGEKCKMKVKFNDSSTHTITGTFSKSNTWELFTKNFTPNTTANAVDRFFIQCGSDLEALSQTVTFDNLSLVLLTQTSVKTKSAVAFSVYPNPATRTIQISTIGTLEKVEIYNMAGIKVSEGKDISQLKQGIYIVVATIDGQIAQQKFYKK
ncbi:T9SS type A sorting domain-containing protein [Labilibacter sediminis]|nr:T9SS type A sorting domain-containing protein [Labilibacter sediminis]